MKKQHVILYLAILTVVGSLFMALASNMIFDDIFNVAVELTKSTLPASLPAVTVALVFVLGVFYVLRIYRHPDCKKRITRLYLIYVIVFGVLGVVSSIISGVTIYHTFTGSHPFPGYLIIFLIVDIIFILCGVCGLVLVRKLKDDEGRIKINARYVFKTIGWFLFICLAFNRFGMLLGAPTYIYLRNLYKTFPFYLYLLMPIYLGTLHVFKILEIFDRKQLVVSTIIGLACNVVLFAYIAIMGINDTAFISALSQAMPLERMASKPIEIIIHFLAYTGVGIAILVETKKAK